MSEEATNKEKIKWRTLTAMIVSAAWLLLACWWTFYRPCHAWAIPAMEPNAWGDWAGGTFAPLAFLWLVVGYFQQGEELRDNVRALHLQEQALQLQVKELRESVEQQSAMAVATARQAEQLEKGHVLSVHAQVLNHQPRFVQFLTHIVEPDQHRIRALAYNFGKPCFRAEFRFLEPRDKWHFWYKAPLQNWNTGSAFEVAFVFGNDAPPFDCKFAIRYRDEFLVEQEQVFRLEVPTWPEKSTPLNVSPIFATRNLPAALPPSSP